VQFSQNQLRHTLGISVETFRHWKRVLPPFARRQKYSSRFSTGDLLAAGVLCRLTDRCGVRVGFLPEISQATVQICNAEPLATLEGKALVVDVPNRTCRIADEASDSMDEEDIVIICPLGPIVATVRDAISRVRPVVARQQRLVQNRENEKQVRRRRA
jgi:hypothetical protein